MWVNNICVNVYVQFDHNASCSLNVNNVKFKLKLRERITIYIFSRENIGVS